MLFSMKYVVENCKITAKTLRFYEEQGILPSISRDEKGNRVYTEQQIDWISFIRCLKETGMPLAKIKAYKESYEMGNSTYSEREAMLQQHRSDLQKKIEESLKHMEEINYKLAMYELQKDEVRKNPNHNFKCHGLEVNLLASAD